MAKNNNLTDFLTDVANAIRAKTGTSGLIDPQDFSSEIASISGGGDVDFTTTNALLDELQTAVGVYPYSVTNTLVGCTTSNNATEVAINGTYSATITADSNYTLTGAIISVTMGGVDVTSTAYNNGVISIASVTGNLVISISAQAEGLIAYATPQAGVTYTNVQDLTSYMSQITEISEAIANCQNITSSTQTVYLSNDISISVGATISYTLTTQEAMTDRILGFNHDSYDTDVVLPYTQQSTATGKAGITWQMVNSLNTLYYMSSTNDNAGGWDSTSMKNTTLPTIFNTLPLTLQNAIVPVIKSYADGGSTNYTETTQTVDTLFLLAEVEVAGTDNYAQDGLHEGTQYKYWVLNNTNSARIKYYSPNGTPTAKNWFLRSCYKSSTSNFVAVSTTGAVTSASKPASTARAVSFAYCT